MITSMNSDMSAGLVTNIIGRDIISSLTSLIVIYGWNNRIDKNPKRSFILGQLTYQMGITIDMMAYLIPSENLMLVAGIGGTGKSVSWITLGSFNAKIIQEIANDNVGEFYAKLSVINTLGQSIGMGLGLLFLKHIYVSSPFVIGFLGILRYISYHMMFKKLFIN
jgi:hypothetical protein